MCHFLYLATPLTLSELRSMLPPGLTGDAALPAEQRTLKELHRTTQTVARVLRGACSCDLVRPRLPDRIADERPLRSRYAALGLPRDAVIAALDRHRRGAAPPPGAPADWGAAIRALVREHARNAGPTLYLLYFGADGLGIARPAAPVTRPLAEVGDRVTDWLAEGVPTVVTS